MRYRLGLSLHTQALGWCLLELNNLNEPIRLIRFGVRLFRDGRNPQDQQSLAATRRLVRGQRRRRDRWLRRQQHLLAVLIRHGLLPGDPAVRKVLNSLDPYELRRKALDQPLPPEHISRALLHLNRRRGFQSNRKLDQSKDHDLGKMKSAIRMVAQAINPEAGIRTVGEWLALRHARRETVRARRQGQGAAQDYTLFIGREMIAAEFDAIWAAQSGFQPGLFTAEAGAELREILLRQRPLKPVKPGRCTLEPDDERAPRALPSAQRFRILQDLNHLRIEYLLGDPQPLTRAQRDTLAAVLEKSPKVSFDRMRKLLKLELEGTAPPRFNFESERRPEFKGNATSLLLSKPDRFGPRWHTLTLARQDAIVEKLLTEESESAVVSWLQAEQGLDPAAAMKIANTGLADGHVNLGRRALEKLLPELQREVVTYDQAVRAAGYPSHSQLHTGEIFDRLPYYGIPLDRHVGFGSGDPKDPDKKRYGRIANPTVHIGLNQVRRVVNAVIERYGPPTQIVLEVARQLKQNPEQRRQIEQEQTRQQKQNDRDNAELRQLGLREYGENLLRLKLWRELNPDNPLNRRCPYSGRQISRARLFSEEVEIAHILPWSRTLDDSFTNKTLAFRDANRYKANRSPAEAFGNSPDGYDWAAIQARAAELPRNKRNRFALDAMQEFAAEQGGYLARHLHDKAYISRIAAAYVSYICHPDDVWVTPGRLNSLLRGKWGLSRSDKPGMAQGHVVKKPAAAQTDHRHHAIDAAIVAVTDQGLLRRLAEASAHEDARNPYRIIADPPWPDFRTDLLNALPRVVVSYRPEHNFEGGMHMATAYGFAQAYEPGKPSSVVHRVPLSDLTTPRDLARVRDSALRERLAAEVGTAAGRDFTAKIAEYGKRHGIRHVRIQERITVIPVYSSDPRGPVADEAPYKAYKGSANYCVEIYRDAQDCWHEHVVTTYHAYRIAARAGGKERLRHPKLAQNGQALVMRLCRDDVVALQTPAGVRTLYRVNKFGQNGQIFLAELHEANTAQRHADASEPFSYLARKASGLRAVQARRVFVTELGFVHDPGFRP